MYNHGITHAILTPAVLNTLNPALLPSLRVVASGGEACSSSLVQSWSNHCDFYNAYGPTEATVCVALGKFSLTSKANCIGSSLGNAKLLVVSSALTPLPIGAIGELLIGGNILAEGYINQPELTQSRFVHLFNERWYRTGDLVRQINPKQFEYFGRQDRQIKLRGLRIELGEIEAALQSLPGIYSAHCLVDKEQILAYITAEFYLIEQDVLTLLARQLPHFLLPNQIIQLDHIPLLSSGKIDFSQLKSLPVSSKIIKPAQTENERQLHDLWCQVLHISAIDIDANFFTLGGNSLQAMSLAFEIEALFSINFPLQMFYTHGSITLQSAFIEGQIKQDISMQSLDELMAQLSEQERKELLNSLEQA